MNFVKYVAFAGSSYIDLPLWVKNKKCCINVKNNDNRCFEYAILSCLYHKDIKKNLDRVNNYYQYKNKLNFEGINFPVDASSYELFEKQNNIPINVFIIEKEDAENRYEIFYISKLKSEKERINILLIEDDDKNHYTWIKNLRGFIKEGTTDLHVCDKCLCKFKLKNAYDNHLLEDKCEKYDNIVKKVLPEDGLHKNYFKNHNRKYKKPFIIYADSESYLRPIEIKKGKGTTLYQNHVTNNIGVKLVSLYPELIKDSYKQFDGENCVDEFLKYLFELENKILKIIDDGIDNITNDIYNKTGKCTICEIYNGQTVGIFKDIFNKKLIGYAHEKCIKSMEYYYENFKIPVVLHNLKNYDSHLILQAVGKFNVKDISCIPNTMEKYMTFSLDRLSFIDSFQFTLTSLEKLVSGLNKANNDEIFKNFNDEVKESDELKKRITTDRIIL